MARQSRRSFGTMKELEEIASRPEAASDDRLAEEDPGMVDEEPENRRLTVMLPAPVFSQLEERAHRDNSSLHAVVIQALAAAGYDLGGRPAVRQSPVLPTRRYYRSRYAYSDLARVITAFLLLSR